MNIGLEGPFLLAIANPKSSDDSLTAYNAFDRMCNQSWRLRNSGEKDERLHGRHAQ